MCLYPRLIRNAKYIPNKKNGGQVPPVLDERTLTVPVGCGDCMECRKQKAREWQVRLLEDIKTNRNGKFVTLTFSNESIAELHELVMIDETKARYEWQHLYEMTGQAYKEKTPYQIDNLIAIKGMRRFLERWRKEHKKSLRHWMVTELGHKGTENIHLHGIIWTNEPIAKLNKHWQYGFTWSGYRVNGVLTNYVNEQTISYAIKYVHKMDVHHKYYKSKILTSAGIGGNYVRTANSKLNKFKGEKTNETYMTASGHKISLPIYYRNKIYTEEEKEKLWISKLDKEVRWVGGEKIDTSKNLEEYFKAVEYYREKNRRLGYGDGKIKWKREEYELQRRQLLQQKRIDSGTKIDYPKEWDE